MAVAFVRIQHTEQKKFLWHSKHTFFDMESLEQISCDGVFLFAYVIPLEWIYQKFAWREANGSWFADLTINIIPVAWKKKNTLMYLE